MEYKSLVKTVGLALLSLNFLAPSQGLAEELAPASPAATDQGAAMQTKVNSTALSGKTFLEENKTKPGIITLPDGLQYKVITDGKGVRPKDDDLVTVQYVGTLIDGTEFDSSYKRGEPATFPVNGVIPGWTEALQKMKVGSTWMLYIPAELAYGEQGAPPVIGANQTLIFKVELLAIAK